MRLFFLLCHRKLENYIKMQKSIDILNVKCYNITMGNTFFTV